MPDLARRTLTKLHGSLNLSGFEPIVPLLASVHVQRTQCQTRSQVRLVSHYHHLHSVISANLVCVGEE